MITAQKLSDDIKAGAEEAALRIVREAESRATLLLDKAQARIEDVQRDIDGLKLKRRDVELTARLCRHLARGLLPPSAIAPLTNHVDGWSPIVALFQAFQHEWGDRDDVFPLAPGSCAGSVVVSLLGTGITSAGAASAGAGSAGVVAVPGSAAGAGSAAAGAGASRRPATAARRPATATPHA